MTSESKPTTPAPPQRIVSLLGAATETLYRLGLSTSLIGRSHECDYPPAVLSLPCVSRPRLDVTASSSSIDTAVRNHAAANRPVYKLDDAVLTELKPDLIIAQDHCRVCAVTPDELESVEACSNVPTLVVKPATLRDCLDDVSTIADAVGFRERGVALRRTLETRLDLVRELVASEEEKRVALMEWCDPIMGCGYWIPELVSLAGGRPLHCPPPGGSTPTISFRSLVESRPEVVVFALCGFGVRRAAREVVAAWGVEKIEEVQNMCGRRVYVVDGNYLVNRSGPRVVESAEAIAEALHLGLRGHFGHFGTDLLLTLDMAIAMVNADGGGGEDCDANGCDVKGRPPAFVNDDAAGVHSETVIPVSGRPEDAVRTQLRHIRNGDMIHAFAINSTANQARWCAPERFAAVLKSHGDFCRLLSEPVEIGESEESAEGMVATVRVSLLEVGEAAAVHLIWTMVAEASEPGGDVVWRTEKVGAAR